MVSTYIVYEMHLWPFNVDKDFTVGNSLLGAVKLIKNTDPDKYKSFGYGIGFDVCGCFSLSDFSRFGKNFI